MNDFHEFFHTLTGHQPFPYQERLATSDWPQLLDIPTGLGKTAAVVVAWLYKRHTGDSDTGRRLLYCLPMRSLVEQTVEVATEWCEKAGGFFEETPSVHKLLGGEVEEEWAERPEAQQIIVGTQDLLLSRALNRGYATSRYRWPMHFGLLSNDCLWVYDETQLMGVGVETGAQLQAFREQLGTMGPARSVWMSATLGEGQLATVDYPRPEGGWAKQTLGEQERQIDEVRERTEARKPISQLKNVSLAEAELDESAADAFASAVLDLHLERGGLTLVILNRVKHAQALYRELRLSERAPTVGLIHSRFRGEERGRLAKLLDAESDRIIVATQAVEAGVDISARTLITTLAPWPSLVQRFGRCNRDGQLGDAHVLWVDVDTSDDKKASAAALPYDVLDLEEARSILFELSAGAGDVGPASLTKVAYEPPDVIRPVLRGRDLVDLFDTTPDICGDDLDVSRYVRDGDDTDVQILWRKIPGGGPSATTRAQRVELCRVSLAAARDFFKKLDAKRKRAKHRSDRERLGAFVFDPLERKWLALDTVRPGQIVLLDPSAGGYDVELGWTGVVTPKDPVAEIEIEAARVGGDVAFSDDHNSGSDGDPWVALVEHLRHVHDDTQRLIDALSELLGCYEDELLTAALWHDVGKAHDAFQYFLVEPTRDRPELAPPGVGLWAKSSHRLRPTTPGRSYFRHELASALAWLATRTDAETERTEPATARHRDLVAYLIAAHHGKVRLSIRSLPVESGPRGDERGDRLFARGVWDGDELPPFEVPNHGRFENVTLDLSLMRLGEGSWLERTLALRDDHDLGPFRLALLEAVLVAADWRASAREKGSDS